MGRIADCDIGVTRPFTFEIISFRNWFLCPKTHLNQEQRMGLCTRGILEDGTEAQEEGHRA